MSVESSTPPKTMAGPPRADARREPQDLDGMLAYLADPEKPGLHVEDAALRHRLLELARAHGVDNIVRRKFGGDYAVAEDQEMLYRIGQAMLLNRLRHEIEGAFAASAVPASVVKGPVFAAKLYPVQGDRLYTDIDFMIGQDTIGRANAVMQELGYVRGDGGQGTRIAMEYKFGHPQHRNVLIELHGDMVHYPLLRRRSPFGRVELLRAGDGDAEAPAALLATAIVHATLGHKFERLAMLVDVLQAARHLPRADYRRFADTLSAMRLALECTVSLGVAARVFGDPAAAELSKLFHGGVKERAATTLLTRRAVIGAQEKPARASWLRRKSFRMIQYLP